MAWDRSRTARALRAVRKRVTGASDGSALIGFARSLANRGEALVRNSYCYRWLTAEPDPEIIVIDLRETRTVGPFIRLLERAIGPVERAWTGSRLASVTTAAETTLASSRTGQLLATLLEPPEPPEDDEKIE